MKKWIVAAGLLTLSSLSQAQEAKDQLRFDISIRMNQVYSKVSEGLYRGDLVESTTSLKITGSTKEGEKVDYTVQGAKETQSSPSEIRIVDGKSLEMKDLKKGVTSVVTADMGAGEIRISSEQIGASIAEELKKQGQDLVKSLSVETEEGKVDYKLNVSDMVCAQSEKDLSCDLSAQLLLDVTGK